uniref:Uncharacterized protein n=1 Tax=Siphoviridae sp. ctGfF74 TaxID=2826223 RepID=A0A8S5NJY5_9CAUD|nr:MAG TPA: hypothetical protein [Siphoviridae sp. ctGfF74]
MKILYGKIFQKSIISKKRKSHSKNKCGFLFLELKIELMFQSVSQWIATGNHSREQPPGVIKKAIKSFF